jgi:nitrile hydratase
VPSRSRNGAKVVAKAWTDPDYRARLLDDGTAAHDHGD